MRVEGSVKHFKFLMSWFSAKPMKKKRFQRFLDWALITQACVASVCDDLTCAFVFILDPSAHSSDSMRHRSKNPGVEIPCLIIVLFIVR